jgi:O-antigen/teichoic acid export membrane protein
MSVEQETSKDLNTDHLGADLRGRSVRGGLLNLTSKGTQILLQTAATVILARLLTPAAFGLVAMVSTVTGLAQAFADLGLSEATIQRKEITRDQVTALFWVNVTIGLGLMLLTMAFSPVIAKFFHDPRLTNITLLSSLTFLFGGLRVQPDALLKRQMRFLALAIRDIVSYAIAVPIAIILTWRGAGYWALVAMPLIFNFIQMSLSWFMIEWRPGLPRRGASVRSMLAFGGNVAASYFVLTICRSADNVLIGWYLGAGPLGLYSRAFNLLMLPVNQLIVPAGSVAVPTLSRIQDDADRFAHYYLRAVNLIIWTCAPVFSFLFVAAQPVIILLLGHQWRDAAPIFQLLAISALGQVLLESTIWLFISQGRSWQLLLLLLVVSPLLVISYAIGLPFGIKGVALSGSLTLLALLPGILQFTFRGTSLTLRRLGRAILFPVSVCLVAVLSAEMTLRYVVQDGIFWQLLVSAAVFAVVFLLSSLLPSVQMELAALRRLFKELRPSRQTA